MANFTEIVDGAFEANVSGCTYVFTNIDQVLIGGNVRSIWSIEECYPDATFQRGSLIMSQDATSSDIFDAYFNNDNLRAMGAMEPSEADYE